MYSLLELNDIYYIADHQDPNKSKGIIKGLSLDLSKRDIHCIVGPSGSGKSTLMKIINGDLTPTAGRIYLTGNRVTNYRKYRRFSKNNISLLPQDPFEILISTATVEQYVSFIKKQFDGKDHNIFEELYNLLEIEDIIERKIKQLSGGERQRLALLVVLSTEFEILLLDEPTSYVGTDKQVKFAQMIIKISNLFEVPIVVTTHSHIFANTFKLYFEIFEGSFRRCGRFFDKENFSVRHIVQDYRLSLLDNDLRKINNNEQIDITYQEVSGYETQ